MRRFHLPLPFLTVFLIVPALMVYVHSLDLPHGVGLRAAVLIASTESAEDLFAQGLERLEQQRYREALAMFEAATQLEGDIDPRALAFHRETSRLRLAAVQNDEGNRRQARLQLLQLAEEAMDEWGARAVRELCRAGFAQDGETQRYLPGALSHWENHPDLELATGEYLEFYRAILLNPGHIRAPLLRMWENLVGVEAPRDELLELGALILDGRSLRTNAVPSPRGHVDVFQRIQHNSGFTADALVRRVATDVLAREPEGWLKTSAHLRSGQVAEREGKFGEAVRHYRDAIASEDPDNAQAVRDARQALNNLVQPQMQLNGNRLYRPGSEHLLSFRWRNLARWTLAVRRVDPVDDVSPPDSRSQSRWGLSSFYPASAGELVFERRFRDRKEEQAREGEGIPHLFRDEATWVEALGAGLYAVTIQGETFDGAEVAPARIMFQVTDLGLTFQSLGAESNRETTEVWVLNLDTGKLSARAELQLFLGQRNRDRLSWNQRSLVTDRDGLARFSHDRSQIHHSLLVGEVDGRPIVALDARSWGPDRTRGTDHVGLVLTDRPLYRPGETVHLQAFVRTRILAERQNQVPTDRDVDLVISAPDGSEFRRASLELDENGALETSFQLPASPALGAYHVQVRTRDHSGTLTFGTFQVDEYRLPEFTVSVTLDDARRYVLGDEIQVEVAAEYLFGGAVAGQAEVVVRRTPYYVHYWPVLRCGWLLEDGGMGSKVAPWYGGGEEVLRLTQTLDDDGRLTVTIPTETRSGDHQSYQFTVEARVTDQSRREETGSSTVRVAHQELFAFLNPVQHVVAPGREAQLRLRIQDVMGRPLAVEGTWSVRRQDKDWEDVLEQSTATEADGQGLLTFRPERPGYYQVTFKTEDSRGQEVTATTTIWCADPKTTQVTHSLGGLQLISQQDEFLGDDVARVLLVSEVPGLPVYLSRSTAAGITTQVIRMEGTVQLLEFPLDVAHRPRFFLRAVRGGDFQLHTADAQILVPLAEQALDVSVRFAHDQYNPGEEAELFVEATDALGNPIRTPLTIAVVDEAVLAILPRSLPDPASIFHNFWTPGLGSLQLSASRFGGYRSIAEDEAEGKDDEHPEYGNALDGRVDLARGGRSRASLSALAPMAQRAMESDALADGALLAKTEIGGVPTAPTTVRSDFRTTALWRTAVMTDADGTATVKVPLAESLTRWEALAVAMTPDAKAGKGVGSTRTRKRVMVRLNHPRVFREQDRFVLAATVHNETDEDLATRVDLTASPLQIEGRAKDIVVPAHGQVTVEWWGVVPAGSAAIAASRESGRLRLAPDEAWVEVIAETTVESDAFQRKVKLLPHGTALRVVAAAELRDGTRNLSIKLPEDRLTASEVATLTLSPSVLAACVDALSYLADYPYGCTEQTLSRFVPAVAVKHAVQALGVSSSRIDPELEAKVEQGLRRILDFQHADGGWGWWKEDNSSAYMTSHVLIALARAVASDVEVDSGALRKGRNALRSMLPELERQPDSMAYALTALSAVDLAGGDRAQEDDTMARYAARLVETRDDIRDYARALTATYLHRTGHAADAGLMLAHLENTVVRDTEYDSVHWGKLRGYWWRGDGAIETTAFALGAFGEIQPEHANTAGAARWLLANRKGARWNSTRDTAHAIYALVDYAQRSGELNADYEVVARLAGQEVARLRVTPQSIVDGGGVFPISSELLGDGDNQVSLTLEGEGVCYATLSVDTWTSMESPEPTKHYLGVSRQVVKIIPTRTLGGAIRPVETVLSDGDTVLPGDRLRVNLTFTAHNDLEYIAVEDPRPAGCEPTDQLSGWVWEGGMSGRREVRDDRTAFFFSSMPQGTHSFTYELRAESPGTFHVMPTHAYAMYVPDVSGTSAEDRLEIARGE